MRRTFLVLILAATACSTDPVADTGLTPPASQVAGTIDPPAVPSQPVATTREIPQTTSTTVAPFARPTWLGTRLLPLREDGFGQVVSTPPELIDRRLETLDLLAPPAGDEFEWSVQPVPPDVLARSSWSDQCPVAVDELAYLKLAHYGFDEKFHTGEMLVNVAVVDDIVEVFQRLHELRFPIEQMRVITAEEIDAHPTGDFNETTSFVCRPAVGSESWSQHAYGLAVDINPFHNPYEKGDLVLPELASAYLDRTDLRPGMVLPGDEVTTAFFDIGFGWGGDWTTLKDWMHFSFSGG